MISVVHMVNNSTLHRRLPTHFCHGRVPFYFAKLLWDFRILNKQIFFAVSWPSPVAYFAEGCVSVKKFLNNTVEPTQQHSSAMKISFLIATHGLHTRKSNNK